jgi:hypothetical protein
MTHPTRSSDRPAAEAGGPTRKPPCPEFKPLALPALAAAVRAVSRRPGPQRPEAAASREHGGTDH